MSENADTGSRSAWQRQVDNIIETQIASRPFLAQSRAVWRQLQDERESWAILLPVVAVVFLYFYRRDRKFIKAVIRDMRD